MDKKKQIKNILFIHLFVFIVGTIMLLTVKRLEFFKVDILSYLFYYLILLVTGFLVWVIILVPLVTLYEDEYKEASLLKKIFRILIFWLSITIFALLLIGTFFLVKMVKWYYIILGLIGLILLISFIFYLLKLFKVIDNETKLIDSLSTFIGFIIELILGIF